MTKPQAFPSNLLLMITVLGHLGLCSHWGREDMNNTQQRSAVGIQPKCANSNFEINLVVDVDILRQV